MDPPRQPPQAPPLSIARRVRRNGEQPPAQIVGVAAGRQMLQELHERFLDDVLRVLVMPEEHQREPIDRRPVVVEQIPRLSCGGVAVWFHLVAKGITAAVGKNDGPAFAKATGGPPKRFARRRRCGCGVFATGRDVPIPNSRSTLSGRIF